MTRFTRLPLAIVAGVLYLAACTETPVEPTMAPEFEAPAGPNMAVVPSGNAVIITSGDGRSCPSFGQDCGRDASNAVVAIDGSPVGPTSSVILGRHPAWSPAIGGTNWINWTAGTSHAVGTVTYEAAFDLPENSAGTSFAMAIAVDNRADVYLNGNLIGVAQLFNRHTAISAPASLLAAGQNLLRFVVSNFSCAPGAVNCVNPAGFNYVADARWACQPGFELRDGKCVLPNPTSREQCKDGGWAAFGFRNQGLCIRFVETGKDSR